MMHVCTVHWNDERWLEPQLKYLRAHLPSHRLYGALEGVDARWDDEFDVVLHLDGPHPVKLNELARVATLHAAPDDLLLFIDSDAFPIAAIDETLLDGHRLVAVRRDENMGQMQPHPCFCLTTVGFWNEIAGDWTKGHQWRASNGEMVTDTGGNLLGLLESRSLAWRPLLRSNIVDLDPLWFAVYGDVVYHHGAGSRPPVSHVVVLEGRRAMRTAAARSLIPASVPLLGRVERSFRFRYARYLHQRRVAAYVAKSLALSDEVFADLVRDEYFYTRFTDPDRSKKKG